MPNEQRAKALTKLVKYTGRSLPCTYIENISLYVPELKYLVTRARGVYKPKGSEYALSVKIIADSRYGNKDSISYLQDGRWSITYSPPTSPNDRSAMSDKNALLKCMSDKVPLVVLERLTDKYDKLQGCTYKILGLGLIESYNSDEDRFVIVGIDDSSLMEISQIPDTEDASQEVQLYAHLSDEFQLFIEEKRVSYTATSPQRDSAFRRLVLREYDYTCAVCGLKVQLGGLSEVTAAHIVPKEQNSTDDPRNGLALCRTHHWAFDNGLFTLTDDYRITLSPVLMIADTNNFDLMNMDGKQILLPNNEAICPPKEVLDWHRSNVWKQSANHLSTQEADELE